jgi:hypothetical protein
MSTKLIEKARGGIEAWQRGDVEALAPLLHPEVELTWWEPGEWDCHGREAVLRMLRERAGEGAGRSRCGSSATAPKRSARPNERAAQDVEDALDFLAGSQ